ncbi:MAG: YihY family inner membrane protein [Streptosporangiaceae bacterium]|nr:YihY family inner membrane protein [Streptosporangiaceae bacterium]MBV9853005.1 YihY family inner membrane protein [Streptosporangiaceae bacterium]
MKRVAAGIKRAATGPQRTSAAFDGGRPQRTPTAPDGTRPQRASAAPGGTRPQRTSAGPDGTRPQQTSAAPGGTRPQRASGDPDGATAVPAPERARAAGWAAAARRAAREFQEDNLKDWAAALTYYGIQSIFPGLLVLVSLLGLVGKSATTPLITSLANAAPGSVRQILLGAMTHLQRAHAAAGLLAVVGIVVGLWSASNYVAGFMRASNAIYDVPEGRPFWKTMPIRFGTTLVIMVLLVASALIVVVTGGLAARVGHVLGIGSAAVTAWEIAKWPVLLIIVSIMLAILYWASPNARQRFRLISPGSVLAVVLWLIASGLFAVYVANFAHYNKVYGSLGGIIIFLIWMWISNVAVLLGAEFNAELERGRAIAGGHPPDREPFTPLRDTRKLRKKAMARLRDRAGKVPSA